MDSERKPSPSSKPVVTDIHASPSANPPPFIPNQPAIAVRFEKPPQPTYPILPSVFSILSLILMSSISAMLFMQLINPSTNLAAQFFGNSALASLLAPPAISGAVASWVWLPFLFTIFGATLGWVFELLLLVSGHAFQQQRSRLTQFVQRIRFLNLAPVTTTIFFFVCAICIPDAGLRMGLLYVAVAATFGLGAGLFLGGAAALPLILLGTQVAQVIIALSYGAQLGGSVVVTLLVAQAILQASALIIGALTPWRSTAFHTISTISGVLLYVAIWKVLAVNGAFSQAVAPQIANGSLAMWGLVIAALAGLIFVMKTNPMTYSNFRAGLSNALWSVQYFLLVGAPRFPNPKNLSEIYKDGAPEPAKLKPYYQQHPKNLSQPLSIPAVEVLEANATVFKKLLNTVNKAFAVISLMDHIIPQANIRIPLTQKPRMNIWSNGEDIYPQLYLKTLFGISIPGDGLDATPEPAIEAFKDGQLLAFLAESGVANPFLEAVPDEEDMLYMNFSYLEQYETKPDYDAYGGIAFFRINEALKKLELVSVIGPHSDENVVANPMDATFRRIEAQILASMYFEVISGKHLAEIHMTYNLVEVCMHNAFDAQGQFNHPLRTFMYLHFFSHELAEELTTEHLLQEGAVFSQVFATTHNSLVDHLNDAYLNFNYGEDEDFEHRESLMKMSNGELLPNACIRWELEYSKIFQKYTHALIDIIYQDDTQVCADQYVQNLYRGLSQLILQGLPERYEAFKTKKGLSRWASDTIQHMVVRHQVYGTTGVRAAMDPRISSPQIPKDGGTPGVDEWRSLISVALATARARFTLLVGSEKQDFTYLLDGVDAQYKSKMAEVFDELQQDLIELDQLWQKDAVEREYNYNYFRAVPSELHTGPGY